MTQDDVLFGYRLQLFALAAERGVSQACRLMGVHRSSYYRWKHAVERQGLEMLRPRERRRPQMPNQLPVLVEQRIVAFCLGHPGHGPRRIASGLARPEWGGLIVSPNGVYKTLCQARPEHAREATGACRGLPGALRAAARPCARAPHRQHASGRAGRDRLLLCRPACMAPRVRSGRSPRSTPTARSRGPTWSSRRRPDRPSSRPPRWPGASRESSRRPAGSSSAC